MFISLSMLNDWLIATFRRMVVKTGRFVVWVTHETGCISRVRSIASGAVVGELAYLIGLGRTTDVSVLDSSQA